MPHHSHRKRPAIAHRWAALTICLSLVAACGGDDDGDDAGSTPTTTTPAEQAAAVQPDEAALRNALDVYLSQNDTPGGVVAVSVAGADPVVVTSGVADRDTGDPMPEDPLFPLGYITDTFVNAVALQVVADGQLSLDDTVADHLPDAPHADELTIQQLLEHTTGFAQWWGSPTIETATSVRERIVADPDRRYTTEEVLDIARELPMTHPPGEGAAVSVPNTLLTRLVIEEATGEDFGDEVRTRLLEPLGLDDTTYGADSRRPDELLRGIRTEDYQIGGLQTSEPNTPAWTSVIDSPGWMASSVEDLVRWGNALYRTDDVIPSDLADRAAEVNDYGSAPIGIALTDDGVCVMLAECDKTAYEFVGFGQPSLAPGTYAGLFYDREIDSVIVVVANGTASIRPLYAAVRDTLTPG